MESLTTLYIPDYVLPNDIPLIKEYFSKLGYGEIGLIELVQQPECEYQVDRDIYSAALVHINKWNDSIETNSFKDAILNNNEAKIIYNENGDYWTFEKANINYNTENNNNNEENFNSIKMEVDNINNFVKNELENFTHRLNTVDYYMYYNTNSVQYLLEKDRRNIIKKNRLDKKIESRRKNLIAQRKWQSRLRPKNILRYKF